MYYNFNNFTFELELEFINIYLIPWLFDDFKTIETH